MVSSSRGRGFGCCPELLKGPTSGHPRVTSDRHCEDIELPAQTVTYNERWRWQEPEVCLRRADVLLPYRASVHRWRNARPLPVRGRHELVSRGVRLMRHDALPWVLGCHSGWFLTNSGLWLTRCCPRSPRVRREEGPLRSTSGPCAGPWVYVRTSGCDGGIYPRLSASRRPPHIAGSPRGPRRDCGGDCTWPCWTSSAPA